MRERWGKASGGVGWMGERGAFFYAMEMGHRGEVICFGAEKAQIHLVNSLKSDLHTDYLPPFVIALVRMTPSFC